MVFFFVELFYNMDFFAVNHRTVLVFSRFSVATFSQMAKKLQSQAVEECKESCIEILSTGPRLDDAAEADALTSLALWAPPPEASLAHIPIQIDYRPQAPVRPVVAPASSGYISQ